MIRSCRDKDTQDLLHRIPVKKFRAIEKAARIKLGFLDAAQDLRDLSIPGLRLKKLGGQERYSIRINDQYRICFDWRADGAYDVEITDYH
jgi:proteic killer suppression protein